MHKRGQESHAFPILAIGVLVILAFGLYAVLQVSKTSERMRLVDFKTKLTADTESMNSNIGSVRIFTYSLPSSVKEVCFLDYNSDISGIGSAEINKYPGIAYSFSSANSENVFLVGDSVLQSYSVASIGLNQDVLFTCIPVENGKLQLTIMGTKDGAALQKDFKIVTPLTTSKETVLNSEDNAVQLTIPADSNPTDSTGSTVNEVSIVTIPDVEGDSATGVYNLGPSGTTFEKPVRIIVTYYPELLGEFVCPADLMQHLYFHVYNDNYVEEEGSPLLPVEVDCNRHTATYELYSFSIVRLEYNAEEPLGGAEAAAGGAAAQAGACTAGTCHNKVGCGAGNTGCHCENGNCVPAVTDTSCITDGKTCTGHKSDKCCNKYCTKGTKWKCKAEWTCTDTEDPPNHYKVGQVILVRYDGIQVFSPDICSKTKDGKAYVKEFYCLDEHRAGGYTNFMCDYGCATNAKKKPIGACKTAPSTGAAAPESEPSGGAGLGTSTSLCTETDSGDDPDNQGTTSAGILTSTDTCDDSNSLTEYACTDWDGQTYDQFKFSSFGVPFFFYGQKIVPTQSNSNSVTFQLNDGSTQDFQLNTPAEFGSSGIEINLVAGIAGEDTVTYQLANKYYQAYSHSCEYGCDSAKGACKKTASCTENWQCTDWSACSNGQQTRTCTDSNNCGTTANKPAATQACTAPITTCQHCCPSTKTCTSTSTAGTCGDGGVCCQSDADCRESPTCDSIVYHPENCLPETTTKQSRIDECVTGRSNNAALYFDANSGTYNWYCWCGYDCRPGTICFDLRACSSSCAGCTMNNQCYTTSNNDHCGTSGNCHICTAPEVCQNGACIVPQTTCTTSTCSGNSGCGTGNTGCHCQNNQCVATCTDSDGGKTYGVQGTTINVNSKAEVNVDNCRDSTTSTWHKSSGDQVVEYFCHTGDNVPTFDFYFCNCENGACKEAPACTGCSLSGQCYTTSTDEHCGATGDCDNCKEKGKICQNGACVVSQTNCPACCNTGEGKACTSTAQGTCNTGYTCCSSQNACVCSASTCSGDSGCGTGNTGCHCQNNECVATVTISLSRTGIPSKGLSQDDPYKAGYYTTFTFDISSLNWLKQHPKSSQGQVMYKTTTIVDGVPTDDKPQNFQLDSVLNLCDQNNHCVVPEAAWSQGQLTCSGIKTDKVRQRTESLEINGYASATNTFYFTCSDAPPVVVEGGCTSDNSCTVEGQKICYPTLGAYHPYDAVKECVKDAQHNCLKWVTTVCPSGICESGQCVTPQISFFIEPPAWKYGYSAAAWKNWYYDIGDKLTLTWSQIPNYIKEQPGCTVYFLVNGAIDKKYDCESSFIAAGRTVETLARVRCYDRIGMVHNSQQIVVKDGAGNVLTKSPEVSFFNPRFGPGYNIYCLHDGCMSAGQQCSLNGGFSSGGGNCCPGYVCKNNVCTACTNTLSGWTCTQQDVDSNKKRCFENENLLADTADEIQQCTFSPLSNCYEYRTYIDCGLGLKHCVQSGNDFSCHCLSYQGCTPNSYACDQTYSGPTWFVKKCAADGCGWKWANDNIHSCDNSGNLH